MADKKRPNVVGKGPAFTREIIATFKEIRENMGSLSDETSERLNTLVAEKAEALEKVIKMAYLKTVKAGEIAWDLKEMALALKNAVGDGDESKVLETVEQMGPELDDFIHKIKTFVVRMT